MIMPDHGQKTQHGLHNSLSHTRVIAKIQWASWIWDTTDLPLKEGSPARSQEEEGVFINPKWMKLTASLNLKCIITLCSIVL